MIADPAEDWGPGRGIYDLRTIGIVPQHLPGGADPQRFAVAGHENLAMAVGDLARPA